MPSSPTALYYQLSIAGILLAVYGCVLFSSAYGILDDYLFLICTTLDGVTQFPHDIIVQGRPLSALILNYSYPWAENVAGLWKSRILGVVGLWGFAVSVALVLQRYGWSRIAATTLALAFCLTPAAGVYAAWASTAQVPLACIAAWWAGYLACTWQPRQILRIAAVILLLIISLCLYQTVATCFWLAVIFKIFTPENPAYRKNEMFPTLLRAALLFGMGLLLYYVAYKAVLLLFYSSNHAFDWLLGRTHFTSDLPAKFLWFFTRLLPLVFSTPFLRPHHDYALVLLLFCAIGISVYAWKQRSWLLIIVAGGSLPLLFFPHLVVTDSQLAFRVMGPISMGVVGWIWVAVYTLFPRRIAHGIALIGMAVFAFTTQQNVYRHIVVPHAREYAELSKHIARQFPEQAPKKALFMRDPLHNMLPKVSTDSEYGVLTSFLVNWAARQIFRERFGNDSIPTLKRCDELLEPNICFMPKQMKKFPVLDTRGIEHWGKETFPEGSTEGMPSGILSLP